MMFIVMAERHCQIYQRHLAVRFWHDADVVPLYRLHEAFCDAVTFRATHSCRARFKPQYRYRGSDRRHPAADYPCHGQ